ncbi:MAG: hypothetical protein J0L69_15050 [Bacteroidetes bacterium]|nr:hypothetical protein [Bacteroidota bacterium]
MKLKNNIFLIATSKYQYAYEALNNPDELLKGTWLVLLHAGRIPAHIGLMINGNYNSLTIKERELNIKAELILKTIKQRSVEAVFFKIIKHPVFSEDYQLQIFQEQMQQYTSVKANQATCLSPIKQFFEEFYAIKVNRERLLFDFLEDLNDNDYIVDCKAINVINETSDKVFTFPTYTAEQLNKRITEEREIYTKD